MLILLKRYDANEPTSGGSLSTQETGNDKNQYRQHPVSASLDGKVSRHPPWSPEMRIDPARRIISRHFREQLLRNTYGPIACILERSLRNVRKSPPIFLVVLLAPFQNAR